MSKSTFKLNKPKVDPEVTLENMRCLRPALVKSKDRGDEFVVIPVYTSFGDKGRTYLCLEENHSPMWLSTTENYEFIRYLDKDESVTITGGDY